MSAERKTTKPKKQPKAADPAPQLPAIPPPPFDFDDDLPTPPLVAEMLDRMNPPKQKRGYWEDEFKLSYYFTGMFVTVKVVGKKYIVLSYGSLDGGEPKAQPYHREPDDHILCLLPDDLDHHLYNVTRRPKRVKP